MENGISVSSDDYKFFVGLYNDDEKLVRESGVLVDPYWIMTSRHMLEYNKPDEILRIAVDPYEGQALTKFRSFHNIEKIVECDEFTINTPNPVVVMPDIVLVKSQSRLDTEGASPIPFWPLYVPEDSKVTVVGLGSDLQLPRLKMGIYHESHETVFESHVKNPVNQDFSSNQCAISPTETGGPIIIFDGYEKRLAGIISTSIGGYPGESQITGVGLFRPEVIIWIENTIGRPITKHPQLSEMHR